MTIGKIKNNLRELFGAVVVYTDNAAKMQRNSEVFSRIERLTTGFPSLQRHV